VSDSIVREYLPGARPADDPAGPELDMSGLQLLPPCTPTKLVIVAGNYRAHCEETGTPIPTTPGLHPIPASCVTSHGSSIVLPADVGRVDYEAELVIVIGKTCRGISAKQAREYVAGYTCGNDVSARDIQWGPSKSLARAKSIDTFTPLGPCLAVGLDPSDLLVEMRVSGELRQSSRTSDMIFSAEELVAESSRWMTLRPGDCILTGTPPGTAPLKAGDVCEVTIEGIGTLTNPVVEGT
jgi:2-keto-4-pentenoate hydratase/2-oxohepta-3-ene-1,7-dioic acid hydratase in catechol pathway